MVRCSCVRVFVCSGVALASFSLLRLAFTLCVKRIVNIMKVYIERKNMQVQLNPCTIP